MQEISLFKKNILEFIEFKGIRKSEFYRMTGITRSVLDKNSGLTEDNVAKFIATFPEVNLEWFVTGKGKMLKENSEENVKQEKYLGVQEKPFFYEKQKGNLPSVITVDSQGEENILMVPVAARAGYLSGYGDADYLATLTTYRMPKLQNGTFRMFEVAGHSMYPTIHQGSIAIGEWVENWKDIKDNQIYIVVTAEDGIVIKRVMNRIEKYNNLYLKSDNRKEYPSYTIDPNSILEVWHLKTALIFEFQDPADLYDRVNDLEVEFHMLQGLLKR